MPHPFGAVGLLLSTAGIALGAVLLCGVVVFLVTLVLTLKLGASGRIEFFQDLRYDLPLRLRLGASAVGVFYFGIAFATILAALWRGGSDWKTLVAFAPVRPAVGAITFLFGAALSYAASATFAMEHWRDRQIITEGPTDLVLLGTIVANLVILAPVAEELVFRGWLYTGLRRRYGFWAAFAVTSLLFAAIHWDAAHRRILLILPLALILGLLRERTGSIKPTILLHGCYNLVIVAITLAATL